MEGAPDVFDFNVPEFCDTLHVGILPRVQLDGAHACVPTPGHKYVSYTEERRQRLDI